MCVVNTILCFIQTGTWACNYKFLGESAAPLVVEPCVDSHHYLLRLPTQPAPLADSLFSDYNDMMRLIDVIVIFVKVWNWSFLMVFLSFWYQGVEGKWSGGKGKRWACASVLLGEVLLRVKRLNPWAEGELSSCAGASILSFLLLMHQEQEDGTRLGCTWGPSRLQDTSKTPLPNHFQRCFPFCRHLLALSREFNTRKTFLFARTDIHLICLVQVDPLLKN